MIIAVMKDAMNNHGLSTFISRPHILRFQIKLVDTLLFGASSSSARLSDYSLTNFRNAGFEDGCLMAAKPTVLFDCLLTLQARICLLFIGCLFVRAKALLILFMRWSIMSPYTCIPK